MFEDVQYYAYVTQVPSSAVTRKKALVMGYIVFTASDAFRNKWEFPKKIFTGFSLKLNYLNHKGNDPTCPAIMIFVSVSVTVCMQKYLLQQLVGCLWQSDLQLLDYE